MSTAHRQHHDPMTVGELSRRTGVPVKALRQYTDWGLIYTIGRSGANYRLYTPEALWCVRWIGELRGLGLTMAEIRELADAYDARAEQPFGPRLAERLRASRERVHARIAEMQQTLECIDEFEANHRMQLTGRSELWADSPKTSTAFA